MDLAEADRKVHEAIGRVLLAPRQKQTETLKAELEKFPPLLRDMAAGLIGLGIAQSNMEVEQLHTRFRWTGIIFGIATLVGVVALAIFIPRPTTFQYVVFRVVLAIGAAGAAGGLTGFLEIKSKVGAWTMAAGGGLAVFLLVFMMNPPALISSLVGDK